MSTLHYSLSETEYLVFKTYRNHFEVYSGHDGSTEKTKIGNFMNGKWVFDDFGQRKLFFYLFNTYKNKFYSAIKTYNRSLVERPKTYVFVCAKRRFDLKVTKIKRNWWNFMYNTFYGR